MPKHEYYLPSRQLVSQQDSAVIERANVPRSRFINAWTRKTTFDAGLLIPFLVEEILPGDHVNYNVAAYVRLSTPLFPIFDSQRIDTFFFFVPNRLVWDNWVRFMGEQDAPSNSIDFLVPIIELGGGGPPIDDPGTIFDHFGLPVGAQITGTLEVNALPFRAYNLIWNQWFRDQNLQDSLLVEKDDGPDADSNYALRYRNKSHDYFTSLLPWPQKFTAPTIPLPGLAPIIGLGTDLPFNVTNIDVIETQAAPGAASTNYAQAIDVSTPLSTYIRTEQHGGITVPQVYANLADTTGVAINTFRQAFMVQTLLERDARGGTRYTELIKSHFGVVNPDFRLQRPEYIGGGQSNLNITPVAQTAPTEGVPVGALGAAGTATGQHRASYAATEHGFIIGLINVRTELSYQQGLHKMWSRRTRYDYYWPALAQLGEQAVLRQEIYATGVPANDEVVLGYQERWHEYRTRVSEITGIFRSSAAGTLDAWHLAQNFVTPPQLNEDFIQDTPPMARILAAGATADLQQYLADIHIQRVITRAIPTFGTPAILGRF